MRVMEGYVVISNEERKEKRTRPSGKIYAQPFRSYAGFLLAKSHCLQEMYTRFLPVFV